jgi:hypothetical protein
MIPWLVWTIVAIIVCIAALILIGGNPQSTYIDDTFFGLMIVGTCLYKVRLREHIQYYSTLKIGLPFPFLQKCKKFREMSQFAPCGTPFMSCYNFSKHVDKTKKFGAIKKRTEKEQNFLYCKFSE